MSLTITNNTAKEISLGTTLRLMGGETLKVYNFPDFPGAAEFLREGKITVTDNGDDTVSPANGNTTSVNSSATPVVLLAANSSRMGATIFNDSTAILYALIGAGTVSATVYTMKIAAQGSWVIPAGYTGIIHGEWASVNGFASVTEILP